MVTSRPDKTATPRHPWRRRSYEATAASARVEGGLVVATASASGPE